MYRINGAFLTGWREDDVKPLVSHFGSHNLKPGWKLEKDGIGGLTTYSPLSIESRF